MPMLKKIIHFIKYHNAFTIGLILVFVASGVIFASDTVREATIGKAVVEKAGIDNTALLAADLDNFDFWVTITGVTEDEKNYYVGYTYKTLGIRDNVWQPVSRQETLEVSKSALAGRDLGLYVTEELGEVVDSELAYLKEVQQKQQEIGVMLVQETTKYTGLIGLVLNAKTRELPGYEPVVKPPELPVIVYDEPESVIADSNPTAGEVEPPDIDTIIDAHPDALTTSTDAVFIFHSTVENATFQCQVNKQGFVPCESPKEYVSLTDGDYLFEVYSVNSVGKYDPTPATFSWTIDTTETLSEVVTPTDETEATTSETTTEATSTEPSCQAQTFYFDSDGDGYGDLINTTSTCEMPAGYVQNNTDCDDTNPDINPCSTEVCDGLDNNCNGEIDENLTRQCGTTDVGACQFGSQTCQTGIWGDCLGAIEPIEEICGDNIDNNCDGQIDENCFIEPTTTTDNQ